MEILSSLCTKLSKFHLRVDPKRGIRILLFFTLLSVCILLFLFLADYDVPNPLQTPCKPMTSGPCPDDRAQKTIPGCINESSAVRPNPILVFSILRFQFCDFEPPEKNQKLYFPKPLENKYYWDHAQMIERRRLYHPAKGKPFENIWKAPATPREKHWKTWGKPWSTQRTPPGKPGEALGSLGKTAGKPRDPPRKTWETVGKTCGKPTENLRKTQGKPGESPGNTWEKPWKTYGTPGKT